ncbi:MAG TPA: GNAT family N-acetyltransferase [Steroidobacteraceae bacterium]|nr:GNAT family N-acetyltransferase [Steroidobacteraceae bacterium]
MGVAALEVVIREATTADFPEILRLNLESERLLSPLSLERLQWLHSAAWYCRIIGSGSSVQGFLIALREGLAYDSLNYRWFIGRYSEFLYVDRVVIDAAARGRQLGVRLYEDLFERAQRAQVRRITCEFDIEPPNEASRRFHERFGFHEVGRQRVAGGQKAVSLQEVTL